MNFHQLYWCNECGMLIREKYLENHRKANPKHAVNDKPDSYYKETEQEAARESHEHASS